MEQGPVEQKIIEQCMREGRELPHKIQNAPSLDMGMEFFFQAWLELGSCRPLGFEGEGPIPWTAISEYAKVYAIMGELRDDLFHYIRSVDNAYLQWKREKAEKSRKLAAPKTKKVMRGGKK